MSIKLKTFFVLLALLIGGAQEIRSQSFTSFGQRPERPAAELYEQLATTDSNAAQLEILKYFQQRGSSDSVSTYAQKLLSKSQFKAEATLAQVGALLDQGLPDRAIVVVTNALQTWSDTSALFKQQLTNLRAQALISQGRHKEAIPLIQSGMETSTDRLSNALDSSILAQTLLLASKRGIIASPEKRLSTAQHAITLVPRDHHRLQVIARFAERRAQLELGGNLDTHLDELFKLQQESLDSNYYDLYTDATVLIGQLLIQTDQPAAAEVALSSAYINSTNWGRLSSQRDIARMLQQLKRSQGDYENAYALITQVESVEREIRQKQDALETRRLEAQYNALEREKDIVRLEQERSAAGLEANRQRTRQLYTLIGFIILLVPILALLYTYYQKLQTQSALNAEREASLLRESELQTARAAVDAQERERARIGRELHDSVGGNLAAIKLQLDREDASSTAQKAVEETYTLVRDLSHDLVPDRFGESPISSLIEQHIIRIKTPTTPEINFAVHPRTIIDNLPVKVQAEIFSMIQELLTNTLKHANAQHVELHLNAYDDSLQLLYEDDGVGFDSASAKTGLGLKNLQARADALNANLTLDAAPGRGVAVTVQIPTI